MNSGPAAVPDEKTQPEAPPSTAPSKEDDGDIESAPFIPETEPCRGPGGPGPETCRARVDSLLAELRHPQRG